MPLRYAVLHHDGIDAPHFDLLFEPAPGALLATWRAERWPLPQKIVLDQLPDHRPVYLDYEGEVSGNRGRVRRVAGGHCDVVHSTPQRWTIRIITPAPLLLELVQAEDGRWQATCTPG